jgi:hypothetical protein
LIYKDLAGHTQEGFVWSPGPRDKTIWVLRPDGTAVVVNPTKREQVEYTAPQYLQSVPDNAVAVAQDILDTYREAKRELQGLGNITPASPDHSVAAAIIRAAELAQQSRKPFIEAHGGRAPISDKRFREIAGQEIEG